MVDRPEERKNRPRRMIERSAGGVVVRRGDDLRVLLILDPYKKWGLPKGHLEDGEGPLEAALREVREETGLDDLSVHSDLGEIEWTFRRARRTVHKHCRFYLMESAEGETVPEVSEGITECRWLTPEEALETISYDNARTVLERGLEQLRMGSPDRATDG